MVAANRMLLFFAAMVGACTSQTPVPGSSGSDQITVTLSDLIATGHKPLTYEQTEKMISGTRGSWEVTSGAVRYLISGTFNSDGSVKPRLDQLNYLPGRNGSGAGKWSVSQTGWFCMSIVWRIDTRPADECFQFVRLGGKVYGFPGA